MCKSIVKWAVLVYNNRYILRTITLKIKGKIMERQNAYNFKFNKVTEEDIIKGAIKSGVAVFLHGRSSEEKVLELNK